MTSLTTIPFLYQGEHPVRAVIGPDGEPWIVGLDICRILGVSNHERALRRIKNHERGVHDVPTPRGTQSMIIVSEPGAYRLIATSNKPAAEPFQEWLYHEVLPAIRRTGNYRAGGEAGTTRANATALNAASRAVGEIRRSRGARAASDALPQIFAKVGITIPGSYKPPQGELDLSEADEDQANVIDLRPVGDKE